MSASYEKTIVVEEDDLDEQRHVNNVRFVQWIQDVSKEHWQRTASDSMRDGVDWVVMNHNITYKRPAKLGDTIKVHTHISDYHGATSNRVVEMRHPDSDGILVHSVTKWCLLNANTKKPTRISNEVKKLFSNK